MSPIRPYHSKIANNEYRFHLPQAFLKTSRLPDTLSTKQRLPRKKKQVSPFLSFQLSAWKADLYTSTHWCRKPRRGWANCLLRWRMKDSVWTTQRKRNSWKLGSGGTDSTDAWKQALNMPVSISRGLVRLTRLNPGLRQQDFFHWFFATRGITDGRCQPLWAGVLGGCQRGFCLAWFSGSW